MAVDIARAIFCAAMFAGDRGVGARADILGGRYRSRKRGQQSGKGNNGGDGFVVARLACLGSGVATLGEDETETIEIICYKLPDV